MNTHVTRRRRLELLWNIKDIVAHAAVAWVEHDASTMGAALAFYTVFSVAPILIIAIAVLGLVIGADIVRTDLLPQMQSLFGDAGASAVQSLLLSATYMGKSRVATVIGVVTLLVGASTVFVELQNSLDRIWGIPKRNRTGGLWRILRSRFLSLGLVFGVGFLLMVSLLVSTVLAALGAWLASHLGEWRTLVLVIDVALSLVVSTVLFAFVYKYVPQERSDWGDVWVGGLVTGPFAQQFANNIAVDPNFVANPSTNVLNAHLGANWNGWDTSIYALNALNSHPLLYNTALETAQFVGPTYTLRPLTVGVRTIYRW